MRQPQSRNKYTCGGVYVASYVVGANAKISITTSWRFNEFLYAIVGRVA